MVLMRSLSADRIGGLIWIVFGAAVIYGSWTMDRLQSLGIPPSTAPGVVPGLLGIGIILFGLVLVLRREAAGAPAFAEAEGAAPAEAAPAESDFHWKRAALSAFLCLTYGGALLGSGVPYWLLTTAFLFLHIVLLDETTDVPARLDRAAAHHRGDPCARRSRSPSRSSSSTSSSCGCPDVRRPRDVRERRGRVSHPDIAGAGLRLDAARHSRRLHAGPDARRW